MEEALGLMTIEWNIGGIQIEHDLFRRAVVGLQIVAFRIIWRSFCVDKWRKKSSILYRQLNEGENLHGSH
jgi:hypothetical protein